MASRCRVVMVLEIKKAAPSPESAAFNACLFLCFEVTQALLRLSVALPSPVVARGQ
jgi:hypothetical protein